MADDIDIEEHDVLENPKILSIFPDLARIKSEIPDDEYEDTSTDFFNSPEQTYQESDDNAEEYTSYGNKIILGSKPCPSNSTQPNTNRILKSLLTSGQRPVHVKQERDDDEQMHSSVFMFGSKPCHGDTAIVNNDDQNVSKDLDDLDIKDSVVYLEDWGPRLESSKSFCKDCEILFPTRNTLEAHNMMTHSLLVAVTDNRAIKSTSKGTAKEKIHGEGKFCNHCNKIFPDSDSLISHLYQTLTSGKPKPERKLDDIPSPKKIKIQPKTEDNIPVPQKIKIPPKTEDIPAPDKMKTQPKYPASGINPHRKYKCLLCKLVFPTYSSIRKHRVKHPGYHGLSIFVTVHSSTLKKSKLSNSKTPKPVTVTRETAKSKVEIAGEKAALIPKATLFKCNKCPCHFTSCTSAILHMKSCRNEPVDFVCPSCDRSFTNEDRSIHEMQHCFGDGRLKVYKADDRIYGRVLNQCPDCKIYLHQENFDRHIRRSCRGKGTTCEVCDLRIHKTSIKIHMTWHEKVKLTRKEMILVEFLKAPTTGKRMSEDNEVPAPKKIKVEGNESESKQINERRRKPLIYCDRCNCSFRLVTIRVHTKEKCESSKSMARSCAKCGLTISSNSHLLYHKENPNLKLTDFKFYNKDRKPIKLPLPQFPRCNKCGVHVVKRATLDRHDCHDRHKFCQRCDQKFSDLALKLHMTFHEYNDRFDKEHTNIGKGTKKTKVTKVTNDTIMPSSTKTIDPTLPELLKKYQQLETTWNILYLCTTCDIVNDDYDKTVEHSQKHFNNMESFDVVIKHCDICDLKFDGQCFETHVNLHKNDSNLTIAQFRVMPYNYAILMEKAWSEQFVSLSRELEQIITRSIYSTFREKRFRVVSDGPPETTLYKCCKCNRFCHRKSLAMHDDFLCKTKVKISCSICGILFSTQNSRADHMSKHKKYTQFRIVHFNEEGDDDFNQALKGIAPVEVQRPTVSTMYQYYKCMKCNKCCTRISKHRCTMRDTRVCKICNMVLCKSSYLKHMRNHAAQPRYKHFMKITPFSPGAIPKLYKCSCGLHFTTSEAVSKHLQVCKKEVIPSEKCSKCRLPFDTTQLVTHLLKHHIHGRAISFEIEDVSEDVSKDVEATVNEVDTPKNVQKLTNKHKMFLHKCIKCNICFNSKEMIRRHFHLKHRTAFATRKCHRCNVFLSNPSHAQHMARIHDCLQDTPTDLYVKSYSDVNTWNVIKLVPKHANPKLVKPKLVKPKLVKPKLVKPKLVKPKLIKPKHTITVANMGPRPALKSIKNRDNRLYKCETCNVFFILIKTLRSHLHRNTHTHKRVTCTICKYDFNNRAGLEQHIHYHHKILKLQREHFQLYRCKFNKQNVVVAVERIPSTEEDTETIESQKDDKIEVEKKTYKILNVLPKCSICDAHMFDSGSTIQRHLLSHADATPPPTQACADCGLTFICGITTMKTHVNMHHKIDVDISDLLFVPFDLYNDVAGNKFLFKCGTCGIHCMRAMNLRAHIAHTDHNRAGNYANCKQCGLAFAFGSLNRHKEIHHDAMKLKREDYIIMEYAGDDDVVRIDGDDDKDNGGTPSVAKLNPKKKVVEEIEQSDDLEEIIDVPKSRNLFKCNLCSTHFVSHTVCKQHMSVCESLDDHNVKDCPECGLRFPADVIAGHVTVHHQQLGLAAKDFQIIQTFVKQNKATHNKDIQEQEKPTRDENRVPNPPSNTTLKRSRRTLYRCKICSLNFLNSKSLGSHTSKGRHEIHMRECYRCGLNFTSITMRKHLKLHHKKLNMSAEDFIIRTDSKADYVSVASALNTEEDSSTIDVADDASVCSDASRQEDSVNTSNTLEKGTAGVVNVPEMYRPTQIIYTCTKCDVNFVTYGTVDAHFCMDINKHRCVACKYCGLLFTRISLIKHEKFHHYRRGRTIDDFVRVDVNLTVVFTGKNLLKNTDKEQPNTTLHDQEETPLEEPPEQTNTTAENDEVSKPLQEPQHLKDSISTLNEDLYSNTLYRCNVCDLHLLTKAHLDWHATNNAHDMDKSRCVICNHFFPVNSLATHVFVHHERLNLSAQHFLIVDNHNTSDMIYNDVGNKSPEAIDVDETLQDVSSVSNTVTKGAFNTELITPDIMSDDDVHSNVDGDDCNKLETFDFKLLYDDNMVESTVDNQSAVEATPDEITIDLDANECTENYKKSTEGQETGNNSHETHQNDYVKLYKCAECNVCFLNQPNCYKHCVKHMPLNARDYIECKICGYQFLITKLHNHISKHHMGIFQPEKVLIEEYNPSILCHGTPKIDIYFGNDDKVQSKLISTTSEAGDDDKVIEIDDHDKVPDGSSLLNPICPIEIE